MQTINQRFGLISEEEYAQLEGKDVRSVRNDRAKGLGPRFIRLGGDTKGVVKYRVSDVEAWLKKRTTDPKKDSKPTLATGRRKRAAA
jgi:hypothetical protein